MRVSSKLFRSLAGLLYLGGEEGRERIRQKWTKRFESWDQRTTPRISLTFMNSLTTRVVWLGESLVLDKGLIPWDQKKTKDQRPKTNRQKKCLFVSELRLKTGVLSIRVMVLSSWIASLYCIVAECDGRALAFECPDCLRQATGLSDSSMPVWESTTNPSPKPEPLTLSSAKLYWF